MFGFIASLPLAGGLKKRIVKFILKRAFGRFLRDELDLDQLNVNLSNGIVELTCLQLNVDVINDYLSDVPFMLRQGFLERVTLTIPWKTILSDSLSIDIDGFELTIDVKGCPGTDPFSDQQQQQQKGGKDANGNENGGDVLSSSILLGSLSRNDVEEEILDGSDSEDSNSNSNYYNGNGNGGKDSTSESLFSTPGNDAEGMEFIARCIEGIVSKIRVSVRNATVRVKFPIVASAAAAPTTSQSNDPQQQQQQQQTFNNNEFVPDSECAFTTILIHVPLLEFSDETPLPSSAVSSAANSISASMSSFSVGPTSSSSTTTSFISGGPHPPPQQQSLYPSLQQHPQGWNSSMFRKIIRFHGFIVQLFEEQPGEFGESEIFDDEIGPLTASAVSSSASTINQAHTLLCGDANNAITLCLFTGDATNPHSHLDVQCHLSSVHSILDASHFGMMHDIYESMSRVLLLFSQQQGLRRKTTFSSSSPSSSVDNRSNSRTRKTTTTTIPTTTQPEDVLEELSLRTASSEQQFTKQTPSFPNQNPLKDSEMADIDIDDEMSRFSESDNQMYAAEQYIMGGRGQNADVLDANLESDVETCNSIAQHLHIKLRVGSLTCKVVYSDVRSNIASMWDSFIRHKFVSSQDENLASSFFGENGPEVHVDHLLLSASDFVVTSDNNPVSNSFELTIGNMSIAEKLQGDNSTAFHTQTVCEFLRDQKALSAYQQQQQRMAMMMMMSDKLVQASRTPKVTFKIGLRHDGTHTDVRLDLCPLLLEIDLGILERLSNVLLQFQNRSRHVALNVDIDNSSTSSLEDEFKSFETGETWNHESQSRPNFGSLKKVQFNANPLEQSATFAIVREIDRKQSEIMNRRTINISVNMARLRIVVKFPLSESLSTPSSLSSLSPTKTSPIGTFSSPTKAPTDSPHGPAPCSVESSPSPPSKGQARGFQPEQLVIDINHMSWLSDQRRTLAGVLVDDEISWKGTIQRLRVMLAQQQLRGIEEKCLADFFRELPARLEIAELDPPREMLISLEVTLRSRRRGDVIGGRPDDLMLEPLVGFDSVSPPSSASPSSGRTESVPLAPNPIVPTQQWPSLSQESGSQQEDSSDDESSIFEEPIVPTQPTVETSGDSPSNQQEKGVFASVKPNDQYVHVPHGYFDKCDNFTMDEVEITTNNEKIVRSANISVSVPTSISVNLDLSKDNFATIQRMGDQIAQAWAASAFAGNPDDRNLSSEGKSQPPSNSDGTLVAIAITVSELQALIRVPHISPVSDNRDASSAAAQSQEDHVYRATLWDIHALQSVYAAPSAVKQAPILKLHISSDSLMLDELFDSTSPHPVVPLLRKNTGQLHNRRKVRKALLLDFASRSPREEPTSLGSPSAESGQPSEKTSGPSFTIRVRLGGLMLMHNSNLNPFHVFDLQHSWMFTLPNFVNTDTDVTLPQSYLQLFVSLHDCVFDYEPPRPPPSIGNGSRSISSQRQSSSPRVAVLVSDMQFSTRMVPRNPEFHFDIRVEDVSVLVTDSCEGPLIKESQQQQSQGKTIELPLHRESEAIVAQGSALGFLNDLKGLGFSHVASLDALLIKIHMNLSPTPTKQNPKLLVECSESTMNLNTCSDSLSVLLGIVSSIVPPPSSGPTLPPIAPNNTESEHVNLFAEGPTDRDPTPHFSNVVITADSSQVHGGALIYALQNIQENTFQSHDESASNSAAPSTALSSNERTNPAPTVPQHTPPAAFSLASILQNDDYFGSASQLPVLPPLNQTRNRSGSQSSPPKTAMTSQLPTLRILDDYANANNDSMGNKTVSSGAGMTELDDDGFAEEIRQQQELQKQQFLHSRRLAPANRVGTQTIITATTTTTTATATATTTAVTSSVSAHQGHFMEDGKVRRYEAMDLFKLDADYFPIVREPDQSSIQRILPEKYPIPDVEIVIQNCNLMWRLFGGWDLASTARKHRRHGERRHSSNVQARDQKQHQHRRSAPNRDSTTLLELDINDIYVQHDVFPACDTFASRTVVSIRDIEILDRVKESKRNKMLGYLQSLESPRTPGSRMINLFIDSLRPDLREHFMIEHRVRLDLLPLRLNIDQSAVKFLLEFSNQIQLRENSASDQTESSDSDSENTKSKINSAYFQMFEIGDVVLKIDYHPNEMDLSKLKNREYYELLNLVPLEGMEVILHGTSIAGASGIDNLVERLAECWIPEISSSSQLFRFVLGFMPIRSMVNIGSGVADLVVIPLEQYKKDGQILRGIRRGMASFLTNVTMETIDITANLSSGTHSILDSLGQWFTGWAGDPTAQLSNSDRLREVNRDTTDESSSSFDGASFYEPAMQGTQSRPSSAMPVDTVQGLQEAYSSLSRGFKNAMYAVVAIPTAYNHQGARGASLSALRAVPVALLHPAIGMTEAVTKILLGVRNAYNPEKRLELSQIYKT